MALTTPNTIKDDLTLWRQVLVEQFDDDNVLTKLWRTSKLMQQFIVEQTLRLTCHISHIGNYYRTYSYPSFLFKLIHLKHLKLVPPPYIDTCNYNNVPVIKPIIRHIPDNVITLDLRGCSTMVGPYMVDFYQFMRNRPQLTLLMDIEKVSRYGWYHIGLKDMINDIIRNTNKPLRSLHTFTHVNHVVLALLRNTWDNINLNVKQQLETHWFPIVATVDFVDCNDTSLEQWCYQKFPNIRSVNEASTVPQTLTSYTVTPSELSHVSRPPPTELFTLPYLTRLKVEFITSPLPQTLPSTLQYLSISIYASYYREDVAEFIHQLPSTLMRLKIVQLMDDSTLNLRPLMWEWDENLLASLPRLLHTFKCNNFPQTRECYAALPPTLTLFEGDVGVHSNADLICGVISPYLTKLRVSVKPEPCITEIPLPLPMSARFQSLTNIEPCSAEVPLKSLHMQLSMLTYFQSLVTLNLMIVNESSLDGSYSTFPITLRDLTIYLNYNENVNDTISALVFPSSLEKLVITGKGTMIDALSWQPLPNSLLTISLKCLNIKSLPAQWPSRLLQLNLEHIDVPKPANNIFGYDVNNLKIKDISNITPSLLNTPSKCIIMVFVDFTERFVYRDFQQQGIEIR